MSIRDILLIGCAVAVAWAARGDGALFSRTFDSVGEPIERTAYRGYFKGCLPKGMEPDHVGRSESSAVSELRQEDGFGYVRFKTEKETSRYIFSGDSIPSLKPGFYKLTVKGRAVSADSYSIELKTVRWIGVWYGSGRCTMPEWTERAFVFRIEKEVREPVAVSLALGVGDVDIASVRLEHADEREYAAKFRRPTHLTGNFFGRRHFAFGLPNGWAFPATASPIPVSTEGTALVLNGKDACSLYSAPFQPEDPTVDCTVRFRYCANHPWSLEVVDYDAKVVKAFALEPGTTWREARLAFRPSAYVHGYSLRFSGRGELRLDDLEASSDARPRAFAPEVHLAPASGEIASQCRIQFEDEPARVAWKIIGERKGLTLRVTVADLYGETRRVDVKPAAEGTFDWQVGCSRPLGAFRISGWLENAEGKVVSEVDELILTRIRRPVTWGKDAPQSRFGAHFRPHANVMATMKAAGINWTRFHDSCEDLSNWYAIEPQKGQWKWPDGQIAAFRKAKIGIMAQLGTTPRWASHFGEMGLENFGYFEKYMRPTNTVDWICYVTNYVGHYQREITDYFIWNEPYWRWWMAAPDIKYYGANNAGRDFGRFCKLTYDAVKAAYPHVNVSGIDTYADGGRWAAQVMSGGGYEGCDQMEFHYYASTPRCRRGRDMNVSASSFASIRAAHPDCKKPIYMTEGGSGMGGVGTGLYRHLVPWLPESDEQCIRNADNTVRYAVSLFGEGVSRIFLYTMHSYRGLGVKTSCLKLLTPDGFPHPALAAHAFMAFMLDFKTCVRVRDFGANGLAYAFESQDGVRVAVIAGATKDEILALAAKRRVFDIFGNAVSAERFLKDSLVYVIE